MTPLLSAAPIYRDAGDRESIEELFDKMEAVRRMGGSFDACRLGEELDAAAREFPEHWSAAYAEYRLAHSAEDLLREHPEECPECHGSGARLVVTDEMRRFRPVFCLCPRGVAAGRGVTLEDDNEARYVKRRPPAAKAVFQGTLLGPGLRVLFFQGASGD